MSRKLATVQIIKDIQPIKGADRIEVATILGYRVVVQKGLHQPGDPVVYFEVDSVLPEHPAFNDIIQNWGARLKTVKLRGQISQGLCIPVAELFLPDPPPPPVGTDVTERLGVELFRHPAEDDPSSDVIGLLPGFIPRSQEPRIQSYPELVDELQGLRCYITVKLNGKSMTVLLHEGEVLVCSRRGAVRTGTAYWKVAEQYGLPELVQQYPDLAIRGELVGPGILGNQLGLEKIDFCCYDVYSIPKAQYFGFHALEAFCRQEKVQRVPVLGADKIANWTVEELIKLAHGRYPNGYPREGIVVRPMQERYSQVLLDRLSFKVLNEKHLLKQE